MGCWRMGVMASHQGDGGLGLGSFVQRTRRLFLQFRDLPAKAVKILEHPLLVGGGLLRPEGFHLSLFSDNEICSAPARSAERLQGATLQSPLCPVILDIEDRFIPVFGSQFHTSI